MWLAVLLPCFLALTGILLVQPSQAQNSPQDYVDAHNVARSRVGVPNITWDDRLAAYAQWYANIRSRDCSLVHSHGPYGENTAYGYSYGYGSRPFTGIDAVKMWLAEKTCYNHNYNSCVGGECLHYTQVIWRNSVRLGCARVQCQNHPNGWWYVTCNYDPSGNYYGKRPY